MLLLLHECKTTCIHIFNEIYHDVKHAFLLKININQFKILLKMSILVHPIVKYEKKKLCVTFYKCNQSEFYIVASVSTVFLGWKSNKPRDLLVSKCVCILECHWKRSCLCCVFHFNFSCFFSFQKKKNSVCYVSCFSLSQSLFVSL